MIQLNMTKSFVVFLSLLAVSVISQSANISSDLGSMNIVYFYGKSNQGEMVMFTTTYGVLLKEINNDTSLAIKLVTLKDSLNRFIHDNCLIYCIDSISLNIPFDTSKFTMDKTDTVFISVSSLFYQSELFYLYQQGFSLERIFSDGSTLFLRKEILGKL